MPTHVQLVRENNLVLRSSHPGKYTLCINYMKKIIKPIILWNSNKKNNWFTSWNILCQDFVILHQVINMKIAFYKKPSR